MTRSNVHRCLIDKTRFHCRFVTAADHSCDLDQHLCSRRVDRKLVGVTGSSNGGWSVEWVEFSGNGRGPSFGELRGTAAGVQTPAELTSKHAVDDEIDRGVGRHQQITDVIVVEIDLPQLNTFDSYFYSSFDSSNKETD